MPRPRSISSAALACGLLFASVSHSDAPATPWGAEPAAETSVADWATTKFAPKAAPAKPSLGSRYGAAPPTPTSQFSLPRSAPPADDRYGAPAPNPIRLARSQPEPLPSGNPLRGASGTSAQRQAAPSIPAEAIAAFREDRPAPPTPTPPAPEPEPSPEIVARFAIEASPHPSEEPPTQEPEPIERITIPAAALTDESTQPEPPAPWSEPAPLTIAPAAAPATKPEPIRVAAAAVDGPARFQSDFQAELQPTRSALQQATPMSAMNEGVGQPGPDELEGPQEASLIVEKRGPREARIGQPCRFAVRVRNTGRGVAENVTLTDQAPAGTRLIGATPTADQQGSRLVWRLGSIGPGEERTVEMRLEPLREGPIGSVARVTMDAAASASTVCTRPQLAVRLSAPPRVLIGDEQVVSIEVHNPGTGAATNVMLTGNLPAAVRHPAGSELEFEVGTLEPGATRRIELKLEAAAAGRVVSAVTVVADGDLRAQRSVEFEVVAPSLAVSIDGPKRRYLERPASYTIGVDNPGTAPAKDVRLVTHLPRGMEFVKANNLGEYDATTHSVYWSLAELPEGERGEVRVVAMPVTAGEHTLKVQSEAASGLKAEHAQRVQVDGVASLAFEVRDVRDPIEVGDDTIYDIRVLNEGTKAATGVVVRVEAPGGLRIAAAEGKTVARTNAGRAEFAPLPRLEPGEKAAYRVRVVGAEAGDQRVTVSVESSELKRPIRREESTRVYGDE